MIAGLGIALLVAPRLAAGQPTKAASPTAAASSAVIPSAKPAPQLMDAAQRHHEDGVRFFEAGNYEAARVEFEAALGLSKEPEVLFNLSLAAEKQGQFADAIGYAERYLAAVPSSLDAEKVRERIAGLRAKLAGDAARGVAVSVPQPVADDVHKPVAAVDVRGGAVPVAPTSSVRGRVPKAALGLMGGGAALLLGGIATGSAALGTARQLEMMDSVVYRDLLEVQRRGDALSTASVVLFATGGAVVVAGAVWGIWGRGRGR